jgi:UPF0042 nucleotide-binding protein
VTKVVVISGLSGSGKTLALHCLEDMGFFAIDNLPVLLSESFVDLLSRGEGDEPRGAFVTDIRERRHLELVPDVLARLRGRGDVQITVIFFEAREETLVQRFSESRRPHPLAQEKRISVVAAIRQEQQALLPLRCVADRVVATDDMSPHELRRVVQEALSGGSLLLSLTCHVVSFGFKFGVPKDVDMLFDARFLPNPYFVLNLRGLDGRTLEVNRFLDEQPDYDRFLRHIEDLLTFVMPRFVAEGKSYLTIAIGCTGGRHRSVAIAERLGRFLAQSGFPVTISHRDLEREAERSQTG